MFVLCFVFHSPDTERNKQTILLYVFLFLKKMPMFLWTDVKKTSWKRLLDTLATDPTTPWKHRLNTFENSVEDWIKESGPTWCALWLPWAMEGGVAFIWRVFLSFTAQIESLQPSQKNQLHDAILLPNAAASIRCDGTIDTAMGWFNTSEKLKIFLNCHQKWITVPVNLWLKEIVLWLRTKKLLSPWKKLFFIPHPMSLLLDVSLTW